MGKEARKGKRRGIKTGNNKGKKRRGKITKDSLENYRKGRRNDIGKRTGRKERKIGAIRMKKKGRGKSN